MKIVSTTYKRGAATQLAKGVPSVYTYGRTSAFGEKGVYRGLQEAGLTVFGDTLLDVQFSVDDLDQLRKLVANLEEMEQSK